MGDFLFMIPKIFVLGLAGELAECAPSIQAFNGIMLVILLAGTAFLIRSPDRRFLLFLASLFLSNLWVAAGGWKMSAYVTIAFLIIQLGIFIFLIVRLKGKRIAAALLSLFFLYYGVVALSIGSYRAGDEAHMFEDDRTPACVRQYL